MLRRARDLGIVTDDDAYWENVNAEKAKQITTKSTGGTFYPTFFTRVGRNLPAAIISAAAEGKLTYRDAASLLNVKSLETLNQVSIRLFNERLFRA